MSKPELPLAIYHEHPLWFQPLFAELERRGQPYVRIDPRAHQFNPSDERVPYSLVFNRMSPSAYLRDGVQGIFYTHAFLDYLDYRNVTVINGKRAFQHETSKALQLNHLKKLRLPFPPSRVINHPSQAVAASEGLRFPVVVKANVGGSGAGIELFHRKADLARAVREGQLKLGVDHTALVQEFIPARGGHITRVEVLGSEFLYAIKVFTPGDVFNLCPGDICQRSDGVELVRTTCPANAPRNGLKVEKCLPPQDVVLAVERITGTAGVDVGGVEYLIDDRDGQLYFYDINALSNFVADAPNVVGFDPHASLADYLIQWAGARKEVA